MKTKKLLPSEAADWISRLSARFCLITAIAGLFIVSNGQAQTLNTNPTFDVGYTARTDDSAHRVQFGTGGSVLTRVWNTAAPDGAVTGWGHDSAGGAAWWLDRSANGGAAIDWDTSDGFVWLRNNETCEAMSISGLVQNRCYRVTGAIAAYTGNVYYNGNGTTNNGTLVATTPGRFAFEVSHTNISGGASAVENRDYKINAPAGMTTSVVRTASTTYFIFTPTSSTDILNIDWRTVSVTFKAATTVATSGYWASSLKPVGGEGGTADSPGTGVFIDSFAIQEVVGCLGSIGNRVFNDNGVGAGGVANDGIQNGTEAGIANVTVRLFAADGSGNPTGSALDTKVTDASGYYRFDGLSIGTFVPAVDVTTSGAALTGFVSSAGNSTVTTLAGDLRDHGKDTALGGGSVLPGGIVGAAVTIDSATQPITEAVAGAGQGANGPNGDASDNLTVDFGFVQPVSLGNYAWLDTNYNGIQDGTETGLPGVTATLYNAANTTPVTTDIAGATINPIITPGSGAYLFSNLPPGQYTVRFTAPAGYYPTITGAGTTATDSNGLTAQSAVLTAGQSDQTLDSGFVQPVSVGDFVWLDTNSDGIQDGTENGLVGVTCTLFDTTGTTQVTTDIAGATINPITTTGTGAYLFSNLPPGQYTVKFTAPAGYYPTITGAGTTATDSNGLSALSAVLASGQSDLTLDSGFVQPVSVGNFVWFDINIDGIQNGTEPGVAGAIVTLYDATNTTPVTTNIAGATINPIITTGTGAYLFNNLPPGQYTVHFTAPSDHVATLVNAPGSTSANDSNGATAQSAVLTSGQSDLTLDTGYFKQSCPDRWTDWQAKWAADPLVGPGQTGPLQNPDGDRYRNIEEYAFCMPPHSGINDAFCIGTSSSVTGGLDGVFYRTTGAPEDVTYYLDYAPTLGLTPNPTSWTGLLLNGSNTVVTNMGTTGREMVRIIDLETKTGLTAGRGFVRIRAELNDGTTLVTSVTEVHGWKATDIEACGLTYNNPFVHCLVFTGTVTTSSGLAVDLSGSTGPISLADALNADLAAHPGASYYIEVTAGDNEGHRFDVNVASATATGFSVLSDSNLDSDQAPFNTLVGPPPASLAGDRIELRRHFTLNQLCPVAAFGSSNDPTEGDLVQIFAGGVYNNYGLFTNSGNPIWVREGDGNLSDGGIAIVAPGQGIFVNGHQEAYDTSILAYGEVRSNKFIRPLSLGFNLVGGGYPVDQSAAGRTMSVTANAFFGNTAYTQADQFLIWRKDFNIADSGFQNYFLFKVGAIERWPKAGDGTLTDQKNAILFPGNRAAFYSMKTVKPLFTKPSPWNP